MWICDYCETTNGDSDKKCCVCDRERTERNTVTRYCTACGKPYELDDKHLFCTRCGKPLG